MRQIELLRLVLDALERLEIPYAVVGSYASGAWGEPRMTRDIDIVIRLLPAQVDLLCAVFPADEFYVSREAANDAVQRNGQFNVIHPSSGNKIDFMIIGVSDWSIKQLERRKKVEFEPTTIGFVAAPDDVILGKLIYYRDGGSDKHLRDIAGILTTSGDMVDRDYVSEFAAKFGVADVWQRVLNKLV